MKLLWIAGSVALVALVLLAWVSERRMAGYAPPEGARLHLLREVELYAIDEGPVDAARTVVLVHGVGGSIDDWDALRAELRRDSRVVTVERPGNGWSGSFAEAPDDYLVANAHAIRELLEGLRVEDPILVGWSYGGAVVLRLAALAPEFPKGVFHLCGIAPGFAPGVGGLQWIGWWLDLPFVPWLESALVPNAIALLPRSLWMETQYGPDWPRLSERILQRTLLGMQRSKLIVAREGLRVEADLERLRGDLAEFEVPTWILAGALDPVIPASVSAGLATQLPAARRMLVPDGRHAYHVMHPETVAARIREFAATLERPTQ